MSESIDYTAFLRQKSVVTQAHGIDVDPTSLSSQLFPFQRSLVMWALRKGRAAIFADTGLGKSFMQLAWAAMIPGRVLIAAPLAVAKQTVREGQRWGIPVGYARSQLDATEQITITNYEMLAHFDPASFIGVVLDESSILKAYDGKLRARITAMFAATPYRLCCTATPAPNDIAELANHAEFLGILTRSEMLAAFFVHDDAGWRLKGHARDPFYRWLASWGMAIKRPSDLGFSDDGYDLPELTIDAAFVPTTYVPEGQLFATVLKGVSDRAQVRKQTVDARCAEASRIMAAHPDESWIAWVGRNDEGHRLAALIPDAVLVEGKDSPESKEAALLGFVAGEHRVLITKPTIAGFGMNFQHCARMVFVGLSDSYEQYYQSIRRCWRFGQPHPVTAYVVLTDIEQPIIENVRRKEREADDMSRHLIRHLSAFEQAEIADLPVHLVYEPKQPMRLPAWLEAAA